MNANFFKTVAATVILDIHLIGDNGAWIPQSSTSRVLVVEKDTITCYITCSGVALEIFRGEVRVSQCEG